jgi:uncharacterized membrane protein
MAAPLDQLIPPAEQTRIVDAIKAAELRTSGEIKVHIEARCPGGDAMKRAVELFARLGLERTRERNGVLIYVAARDRMFALRGDQGIHEEVGSQFWSEAAARMTDAFKAGRFADGVVGAVEAIGARLAQRFPPRADDQNELSDEISTDEKAT